MKTIDLRNVERVLYNEHGDSTNPSYLLRHGKKVHIDVVYIRTDGWMLGAPKHLAHIAEQMWLDEWEMVVIMPWAEGDIK